MEERVLNLENKISIINNDFKKKEDYLDIKKNLLNSENKLDLIIKKLNIKENKDEQN